MKRGGCRFVTHMRTMPVPRLTVVLFRSWLEYFMRLFLLSIKWQLKLLNYTFIEIYEFLNQNLWLGARQDHWLVSHAHQASNAREKRRNVERERERDWNVNRHDEQLKLFCIRYRKLCGFSTSRHHLQYRIRGAS